MNSKNIIIIAGGIASDKLILDKVSATEDAYIIGVDKGVEILESLGIIPDLIIGDFDSAHQDVKKKYENHPDAIILNPIKDATDTHMAVLEAMKLKPDTVTILGATGGRLDHMMGNFALLKLCLDKGIKCYIIDEQNKITMIDKQLKINKKDQYGKYVSLIPFSDEVTGITLTGFSYELSDATIIKADTIGISNEIREEEGFITIKSGHLMVMETKD